MGRDFEKDKKEKMTFYSPLRYPGGKNKLVKFFKRLIDKNSLWGCTYIEPYAGGASVGLALLIEGCVSNIIINDIDRSIYAFWHSVLNETDKLCGLIKSTPVNLVNWKKQKEIYQKKETEKDLLKVGFSTFFLNRTNYSGILGAGAIGGLKQKGKWKINARYNKKELIKRIKKISLYKNKIKIYNENTLDLIKYLKNRLPEKSIFYLDPPYYVKGKELYLNFYVDKDHQQVAKAMFKLNKYGWVITYDNVNFIRKLYAPFKRITYSLKYSAGKKKEGGEVSIFSNNLIPIKPQIIK